MAKTERKTKPRTKRRTQQVGSTAGATIADKKSARKTSRSKGASLADRAFEDIKEKILKLYFLPGQYLNEGALCALLNVGRTPVHQALQRLQHEPVHGMRIRTALVTARSAPAHERAIRTLMQWNVEIDEAMFLGGLPKGEFLREFEPDFFFDDQTGHIENASAHVPSGHVAAGVSNLLRSGG